MNEPEGYTAAVLTVSDRGSRGERVDTAGPAVAQLLEEAGVRVVERALLPDDEERVATQIRAWSDAGIDLVVTAGGTGLAPTDRTPEATRQVIDYEVPGIAEGMRAVGRESTALAMLSRGVVGVRGATLIVNLPGSERGARENIEVVIPILRHAIDQLHAGDHPAPGS